LTLSALGSIDLRHDLIPLVLGGLTFVGVTIFIVSVFWPRSAKRDRIGQIAHFGPARTQPARTSRQQEQAGSPLARMLLDATASVVRSGGTEEQIQARLDQAGIRMRPQEWVLIRACVAITAGALGLAVGAFPGAVIGVIAGWLATTAFRLLRRDQRQQLFTEQLPDALQLLIGSLKSGFSLTQSIDALVRESPEPVGPEFGRALAENRLGADISDALERVATRTKSDDLGWAVMAVRIQRDIGGNLAEVLQTTVDTMRERARLRRHIRSLSAEGRLSAVILISLPIVLGAFMLIFRRAYLRPLFTERLGIILLVGAATLMAVGVYWMTRVVRVKV
jgi:tight adherence protein B